jgi:hypothetical protein
MPASVDREARPALSLSSSSFMMSTPSLEYLFVLTRVFVECVRRLSVPYLEGTLDAVYFTASRLALDASKHSLSEYPTSVISVISVMFPVFDVSESETASSDMFLLLGDLYAETTPTELAPLNARLVCWLIARLKNLAFSFFMPGAFRERLLLSPPTLEEFVLLVVLWPGTVGLQRPATDRRG